MSRILGLLIGQGLLTASRSTPAAVLIALNDDDSHAQSVAIATALRSRGIACEVAPKAEKFGKQIRYAQRRGIKDIRSGEQVAADPHTWQCPAEDLRPSVTRTATES